MKKPENSLYPPDWLKVAKKDWHRMKIMLDEEDAEAAGLRYTPPLAEHNARIG